MKKFLLLIILHFFVISAFSQHQIIDADSKEPVSYAHIKSVNKLKVIISDYHGFFVLDSSFRKLDSIVISCIGYKQKKILLSEIIEKKVVELDPSTEDLSEVIVTAKKTKFKVKNLGITKKPKKLRFGDFVVTGKNGEEKAMWIPNDYSIPGYLKSVNIYVTDLGYPDAHFRIHVYSCNKFETKPDSELTSSNIIASSTKGNEWVTVDMSNEQLRIGENGCFIGIEWFDSPKSKFHKDTVFSDGQTWDESKRKYKDTTYSSIRSGNGTVLGGIFQKYRYSKNRFWIKEDNHWQNRGNFAESRMYTTDTFPDGRALLTTPDNYYLGVMCINIDVSFPKRKIDLVYKEPKRRKFNKLEKVKRDLSKYPQNNIHDFFSSLIKAFENDDIVYVLKYLCVYKEDQLNEVLSEFENEENENYLTDEEKDVIVNYFKELQSKLNLTELTKVDDKHFELSFDNMTYNLVFDDGLWRINPYSYRIYK